MTSFKNRLQSANVGSRFSIRTGLVAAIVVVVLSGSATAAILVTPTSSGIKALPVGTKNVISTGPDAYPSMACLASDPTQMLLPIGRIPDMALGVPQSAQGGQSLTPMAIPTSGSNANSLMSAAVVEEHLFNTMAPMSAIQSVDPFNSTHPKTITTFDEGVTGFTSTSAESSFYSSATSQSPTPENVVNGVLLPETVSSESNYSGLPSPNVVTIDTQPSSDVPTVIQFTIESGQTILSLSFEGGTGLTLSDVLPYAQSAIDTITNACGSLDIMAPA
jgi:hypothetical protein